ncbi:hypothetical protein BSLG_005852 [Batrachochytrium salamandrivorans]|nr:hypothetical protein BSLG_005852 [Batrachochytrium salamandrivorans]
MGSEHRNKLHRLHNPVKFQKSQASDKADGHTLISDPRDHSNQHHPASPASSMFPYAPPSQPRIIDNPDLNLPSPTSKESALYRLRQVEEERNNASLDKRRFAVLLSEAEQHQQHAMTCILLVQIRNFNTFYSSLCRHIEARIAQIAALDSSTSSHDFIQHSRLPSVGRPSEVIATHTKDTLPQLISDYIQLAYKLKTRATKTLFWTEKDPSKVFHAATNGEMLSFLNQSYASGFSQSFDASETSLERVL